MQGEAHNPDHGFDYETTWDVAIRSYPTGVLLRELARRLQEVTISILLKQEEEREGRGEEVACPDEQVQVRVS